MSRAFFSVSSFVLLALPDGDRREPAPPPPGQGLKRRFRVGGLDLLERRKRYTSTWVEEEEGAQSCPCGNAGECRTHIVGECELYEEERNVLEEDMSNINECDTDKFGAIESNEKLLS